MNILLWVLQVLLALWFLTGGGYEMTHYDDLKAPWADALPGLFWMAYGALEVLFAIGLVWPKITRFAAVGLAVLALSGCGLFAKYIGFPDCLWGVAPAILSAFVAYGRFKLKPF